MKISLNRKKGRWISLPVLLLASLILSACGNRLPSAATATQTVPAPTVTSTRTAAPTATPSPLPTATATVTPSPTDTLTPTVTPTPTITPTPTQTLTPTFDFPDVIVQMQANCRYGPGTAYLYSFGLYQGDTGMVGGRNYNNTWLWIKPSNLDRYCWVSSSVVQIQGDVNTVRVIHPALPHTTFAGPPGNVQAVRSGDQVRVSWDEVPLSEDKRRGYLLEASVCQNGDLIWMAVQTDSTSYEFTDQQGCKEKSGVLLYTAEKHGYSDPVQVPWPKFIYFLASSTIQSMFQGR